MMNCTPPVRSDSAPTSAAARPDTMIAAGSVSSSWSVPGITPRNDGAGIEVVIEDADDIAADAEEGGVAKADHAAKAEDEVQAGGSHAKDQHLPDQPCH